MISGVGPAATILYYRLLVDGIRSRSGGRTSGEILIESLDLEEIEPWFRARADDRLTERAARSVNDLAGAGCEAGRAGVTCAAASGGYVRRLDPPRKRGLMSRQPVSRAALTTYLGLTFASSAVLWWLIVTGGGLQQSGWYVFVLMWCPGTSALITRLIFQRNLRGQGWLPGAPRWLAWGYLLPVAYATVAYGLVWVTGLGGVDFGRFQGSIVAFLVLGSLQSTLSATGEELGWRGFLVPALAQRLSFTGTAAVSGLIWAGWHVPLIVFADYNAGTSTPYAILCFAVMVVAMSFAMAWIRLRSESVWPAALMHASHNLFVQAFFDRVTVDTGRTLWFTTEFGAALALTTVVMAWLFWRRRAEVTMEPLASSRASPVPRAA